MTLENLYHLSGIITCIITCIIISIVFIKEKFKIGLIKRYRERNEELETENNELKEFIWNISFQSMHSKVHVTDELQNEIDKAFKYAYPNSNGKPQED